MSLAEEQSSAGSEPCGRLAKTLIWKLIALAPDLRDPQCELVRQGKSQSNPGFGCDRLAIHHKRLELPLADGAGGSAD